MPYYTYKCEHCGYDFEELMPMSEYKKQMPCQKCGSQAHRTFTVINWQPFPGSVTFDRQRGFLPGTSANDFKGWNKKALKRME